MSDSIIMCIKTLGLRNIYEHLLIELYEKSNNVIHFLFLLKHRKLEVKNNYENAVGLQKMMYEGYLKRLDSVINFITQGKHKWK